MMKDNMIAAVPAPRAVRRLEYTWAFDAWAARSWDAGAGGVVLASAPAFVREAAERLPDVRVLATMPSAREAAIAAGVPLAGTGDRDAWGSALWATPVGGWQAQLGLAAEQLPAGAPFFVLATGLLGGLLDGLRAAHAAEEAGAPVWWLSGKLALLEQAGFRVREVVGLRAPGSLVASAAAGVAGRAGRADVADRLEQRARASFVAAGVAAGWSSMVLIETVRR